MSGIQILVSDHHGIYIPQVFAEKFNWSGSNIDDLETIEKGPEAEWYWEAWENVINDSFHNDKDGNSWRLYQDGDLFAYCSELMTDEEYKDFFGEERND